MRCTHPNPRTRIPFLKPAAWLPALALVAGSAALHTASAASATPAGRTELPVIGYWANWGGGSGEIQYPYLTHVLYAFAHTNGSGTITGVDEGQVNDLVTRGQAVGVKVGIAIGGWGFVEEFTAMTSTPASIDAFIANSVALCERLKLDGIDIDWEYPTRTNAGVFESLMTRLGEALHAKGKFLSLAVIGGPGSIAAQILPGVFAAVDFVNIMAYDGEGFSHSTYEFAELCLQYWVETRQCPREKAILGVPFYGKMPETEYKAIIAQDRSAAQRDNIGDLYYNGIPTIQKKTRLAHEKGGGIMMWQLAGDTHDETSLLKAIYDQKKVLGPMSVGPGHASGKRHFSIGLGRVRFAAPARGAYVLTIRSLAGARLLEIALGVPASGESVFPWDARGVAAGVYTATLQGESLGLSGTLVLPGR